MVTGRGRNRSPNLRARRPSSRRSPKSPFRYPKNQPSRHPQNPPSRHQNTLPPRHYQNPASRTSHPYSVRGISSLRRTRSRSRDGKFSGFRSKSRVNDGSSSRGRTHRNNSYFSSIEKHCITFFFTNFPEEYSTEDLWCFFGKIGVVGDIAIPPRRDAKGRLFGFVRFKLSNDEARLEEAVKNLAIGKYKLIINKPRFSRGKIPLVSKSFRNSVSNLVAIPESGQQRVTATENHVSWSEVVRNGRTLKAMGKQTGKLIQVGTGSRFTYLEPVFPVFKHVEVDFMLEVPEILIIKCDDLVIADLEFDLTDVDANTCLARNGVLSVQVIPMDCSTVILKGLNIEEVEEIFNLEETWWRTVFASFRCSGKRGLDVQGFRFMFGQCLFSQN